MNNLNEPNSHSVSDIYEALNKNLWQGENFIIKLSKKLLSQDTKLNMLLNIAIDNNNEALLEILLNIKDINPLLRLEVADKIIINSLISSQDLKEMEQKIRQGLELFNDAQDIVDNLKGRLPFVKINSVFYIEKAKMLSIEDKDPDTERRQLMEKIFGIFYLYSMDSLTRMRFCDQMLTELNKSQSVYARSLKKQSKYSSLSESDRLKKISQTPHEIKPMEYMVREYVANCILYLQFGFKPENENYHDGIFNNLYQHSHFHTLFTDEKIMLYITGRAITGDEKQLHAIKTLNESWQKKIDLNLFEMTPQKKQFASVLNNEIEKKILNQTLESTTKITTVKKTARI